MGKLEFLELAYCNKPLNFSKDGKCLKCEGEGEGEGEGGYEDGKVFKVCNCEFGKETAKIVDDLLNERLQ